MHLLITGHRLSKLQNYDIQWIRRKIWEVLTEIEDKNEYIRAYAGMASGVDLWFGTECIGKKISLVACIPFEGQDADMSDEEKRTRNYLIDSAVEVRNVKNSWMVEQCDTAIVVWDGNKGGTHNVVQQLVEKKKDFYWLNPVSKVVWRCFVNRLDFV